LDRLSHRHSSAFIGGYHRLEAGGFRRVVRGPIMMPACFHRPLDGHRPDMLKLATLIDNPGEPTGESRYRDPAVLRELGYNAVALYETTGLSGLPGPEAVADAELRRWVSHHFDHIKQRIERAVQAGLQVYLFYDLFSLPRDEAQRQVGSWLCKNRPPTLCPASEGVLQRSAEALEALLTQWPTVSGVVLRFGDNDAARMPHLIGNDILSPHCPRCAQFGRADRIVTAVTRFHDLVVNRLNKRLICRAWNVRPNGLHDSVELATRVAQRLPGADNPRDDRFILSFKFTHTDFWRYQPWNPASLVFGQRPILYELQCQREFEGKGGVPDWQPPLWRDGPPECPPALGLAHLAGRVNLAGLWAWVRGGGWGGPFVKNETWIDANVFAVPLLAQEPTIAPRELAQRWIEQHLNIADDKLAAALLVVLERSTEAVRKAFYIGPFARRKGDPWHPNADWIQDDVVDAQAAWRMIQRLPESDLDAVVQEKQEAAASISDALSDLYPCLNHRNRGTLEPLINSLTYTESLFEALRDLLTGLVAYRRFHRTKQEAQAQLCKQKLLQAQSHWNHHTQRHGALPGAATAFRENHFWDLTQRLLGEVAEFEATSSRQ
jgi:hypothetical protein